MLLAAAPVVAAVAVVVLLRGDQGGDTPPREARAPSGLLVGVAANTQDTNVAPEQDAARELGAQVLREEVRWPEVEPQRGRFDDRRYDALTTLAARRGMRILPLLFLSPKWLTPHETELPPSLPLWQRFVRHVVGRYGPGGVFWRAHPELDGRLAMTTYEVWNEPYLPPFSYGGLDPAGYARLVRATVAAGHAVNPDVGFLAAVETVYDAGGGEGRNWAEDLFAADPGLGALLAGVAVHPYAPVSPALPADPAQLRFARIDDVLAIVRRHGVTGPRPLWITELGWSTCPSRPPCVSLADQATFWRQALERIDRPPLRGAVGAVFAFNLRNLRRSGPGDPQGDYGLITARGGHKPAWAVVRRAALAARAAETAAG